MIIQKMQNNNKGYGFNEVFIHFKQLKCLFTGKNVAKRRENKKRRQKSCYGRHYDIPACRGMLYNLGMRKTDE